MISPHMESLLAAGLCLLFGTAFGLVGRWLFRRSSSTSSWLPVPATVLDASVLSDDGSYVPHVRYKYAIDGGTYESTCIALIQAGSSFRHLAQAVVQRYPPSSQIVAYVDPLNHSRAVLQPGRQLFAPVLLLLVGFILLALGVGELATISR